MRSQSDKKRFLAALAENGNVSYACRKSGVAYASVYRWRGEDPKFNKKFEEARRQGWDQLCDLAESKIVQLIKKEYFPAIKFTLESLRYPFLRPRPHGFWNGVLPEESGSPPVNIQIIKNYTKPVEEKIASPQFTSTGYLQMIDNPE